MNFTRYLIGDDVAAEELARKKASLLETQGQSDFGGFAAGVLARRMQNHPELYLEFGPYWWALKAVLARSGHVIGDDDAPALSAAYTGIDDDAIIVKAEIFKELYRQTWSAGTRVFDLDEAGGDAYRLVDLDMESKIGPR
jgi:hypothetical protein